MTDDNHANADMEFVQTSEHQVIPDSGSKAKSNENSTF